MSWKWERELKSVARARLVVEPSRWRVEAYFPGPDLRYSGDHWTLPAEQVRSFMAALQDAWARLEQLENLAPGPGDLKASGAMDIQIIVRGYPRRGITVHRYNGLIPSRENLDDVLGELDGLEQEALQVQQRLKG